MWQPCPSENLDEFMGKCEDSYACLRAFMKNLEFWTQNPKYMKDFAQNYIKYKDDPNEYSLYVWGFVMLMVEYHKTLRNILDRSGSVDTVQVTTFGKLDEYPQFEEQVHEIMWPHTLSHTRILRIDESGDK